MLENEKDKSPKLLLTDTNSFIIQVRSDDINECFWKDRHLFDFSNYPKDSKYYDNENKKVLGKFKDECAGDSITEFCRP